MGRRLDEKGWSIPLRDVYAIAAFLLFNKLVGEDIEPGDLGGDD